VSSAVGAEGGVGRGVPFPLGVGSTPPHSYLFNFLSRNSVIWCILMCFNVYSYFACHFCTRKGDLLWLDDIYTAVYTRYTRIGLNHSRPWYNLYLIVGVRFLPRDAQWGWGTTATTRVPGLRIGEHPREIGQEGSTG